MQFKYLSKNNIGESYIHPSDGWTKLDWVTVYLCGLCGILLLNSLSNCVCEEVPCPSFA